MNEARLEFFADDIDSPPQLSRSLPAALDGLVDYKTFQEFADQLDELLILLDAEHERLKNRYWWTQYGIYTCYPAIFFFSSYLFVAYFWVWIIYLLSVRQYTTHFRKSPKSIDEIIKEIRSLCEVVTNRTPHVSFHPMIRPFPTGSLQMDFIEYIYISISDHAFAEVLAAAAAAVINIDEYNTSDAGVLIGNASVATPCDYRLLEVV
jgi:hypothetical protein